jgi:phage terminase large subunit
MVIVMADVKVGFNPIFKSFNKCKKRYRLAKGSAGSGKSVNIARDYILKLGDHKYKGANLLVVRKIGESNKDSTFAELRSAIFAIYGKLTDKYWTITTNPLYIENKVTGNSIIFRGMKDDAQKEKVKSITFANGKLTWIWIEEATELKEEDIDILDDRLRGLLPDNLYYQITFSFNPVSATHFIKSKFFDFKDDDIFTHQSTYLDNRFIDEAYHKRMMRRKAQDPDGYKVYGLGEWGELGGLILNNIEVIDFEKLEIDIKKFDNRGYCQDFGFNHANAILEVAEKDNCLYVDEIIYVHEKDTNEIINLCNEKKVERNTRMICDCAEPDRIKMFKRAGYNAVGVKKYQGSVVAQIDRLKQYDKIYINSSAINTYKESQQWKWKKDKDGNYIDTPVDFFDDAMAALRYSTDLFHKASPTPVNVRL